MTDHIRTSRIYPGAAAQLPSEANTSWEVLGPSLITGQWCRKQVWSLPWAMLCSWTCGADRGTGQAVPGTEPHQERAARPLKSSCCHWHITALVFSGRETALQPLLPLTWWKINPEILVHGPAANSSSSLAFNHLWEFWVSKFSSVWGFFFCCSSIILSPAHQLRVYFVPIIRGGGQK